MDLVQSYPWDKPDPAGEEISAGDLRSQIFLPDRDFSLQTLRTLAGQAPAPKFRHFLNQLISEENLSAAMSKVNEVVSNLFMLWVGPYLCMDERS